MSPENYIEIITMTGDSAASHAMNAIAILFAYIVAAYIAAGSIGRYQLILITLLYSIFLYVPVNSAFRLLTINQNITNDFFNEYPAMADRFFQDTSAANNPVILALVYLIAWLLSLVFMYKMRIENQKSRTN